MSYITPLLNSLMMAAKKAGNGLTRDFNEIEKLQSSVKGHKEFVAAAFAKVEKTLRTELAKAKPDYPFAVDGAKRPDGPYFAVAPLDGVVNFAHGVPHFAISIAVCDKDAVTAAVVYNPATDELYFAERGNGAFKEGFRNHERLRVSSRKDVAEALVSTEVKYRENISEYNVIRDRIMPAVGDMRILGATALDLAYVAAGKFDATVSFANGLSAVAAGLLLIKEAGGYIYEINQKDIRSENLALVLDSGNVIGSNANLSGSIHALLNK